MDFVIYNGTKYEIKEGTLKLTSKGIEDIIDIENLDKIREITKLDLSYNKIKEIKGLDKLINLKILKLDYNKISEIKGLTNLRNLKELSLSDNHIFKIEGLENLKHLETLNLYCNRIEEIKGLDSLLNLKILNLWHNQISGCKGLEKLKKLKKLNLSQNEITEIKNLDNLKDLENLILRSNKITEIKNLDNLNSLRQLWLGGNKIQKVMGLHFILKLTGIKDYFQIDYLIDLLVSNANSLQSEDKKIIEKWILSLNNETVISLIEHGILKCLDQETIEFLINDQKIKNKIMEGFNTRGILKEFFKFESKTAAKIMKEMLLKSIISRDYPKFSDYLEYGFFKCYDEGEFEKILEEYSPDFYETFIKMISKDFGDIPSKILNINKISPTKVKMWLQEIIIIQIKSKFSSRAFSKHSNKISLMKYIDILSYLNNKSIVIALLEILEDHYWIEIFTDIKNLLLKTRNYNPKKLIQQLGQFINKIKFSYRDYIGKIFEEMHELLKCVILGCYSINISSVIENINIIFQLIITLDEVISYRIMDMMDAVTRKYNLDSYEETSIEDEEFERWFSIKDDSGSISLQIKNDKLIVSYPDYTPLKHKFKEFNQEDNKFKLNTQMVIDENLLKEAWFKNHLHYFYEVKTYNFLLRNLTEKYKKKRRQEAEEKNFNSKELITFRNAKITRKEVRSLEDIELQTMKNFTHEDKKNFDEIVIYTSTSMTFTTENHRVTGLSLKDSKIKKVPYSIGNLTELRELYIKDSEIWSIDTTYRDFLPESIGNLEKLEILIITGQDMKVLPKSIGNLTNLYHLDLSDNGLEILPEQIGNLHLLKVLILDLNKIKRLPQSISKLKSLITLSLTGEGNFLMDTKGLKNLENLEFLDFLNNRFKEIPDLGGLHKLKFLNLKNNRLVEIKGLENLNNLKILILTKNKISDIKGLENLTNLEELDLGRNNISEIKGLDKLTNLNVLYLNNNNINDITGLTALTKLKVLEIRNNNIKEVKGLENLMELEKFGIGTNFTKEIITKLGGYEKENNPLGEEFAQAHDPSQFVEYCCKLVNKNVNFYKIREEKFDKLLKERLLVDNVKFKILKAIYQKDPNDIDLIIEKLDDSHTNTGDYQHIFQLIEQKVLIKEPDTRTVRMNPLARSALRKIFNETNDGFL